MKNKTLLMTLLTVLVSLMAPIPAAHAAGSGPSWPAVSLSANKTAATTNDTITITARFFLYECKAIHQGTGKPVTQSQPEGCDEYFGGTSGQTVDYPYACPFPDGIVANVVAEGEAITLSKAAICGSGTDSFTVKSSVAGAKTIKIALSSTIYTGSSRSGPSLSVNFAAPAVVKPKVTTPAPAPAPVVVKPAAPTVATIMANDAEIKTGDEISVTPTQPLVLSGKTVANGKVSLWVFSEPKLYETTADKDGNWSVKVEGLPEGSHHAEVEVTDPASNQKSDRVKLLDFKVVADKKPTTLATANTEKNASKAGLWIALAVGVLLALAAAVTVWYVRRRKRRTDSGQNDDNSTGDPTSSSGGSTSDGDAQGSTGAGSDGSGVAGDGPGSSASNE